MTAKKFAAAAVGAAVALLIADAALAQAAPPKPAATTGAAVPPLSAKPPGSPAPAAGAPQIKFGPTIPGVCIYSQQTVVGASTVGKAVQARLKQLQDGVDAEMKVDQAAIDSESKAIVAAQSQPGADALDIAQRKERLQAKFNLAQRKYAIRDREMQATEQKQFGRILDEASPLAISVFQARGCSILLNGDGPVMLGAPSMDITGDVIKALNAKLTTLTFDRERLEQPQAPAPAPAPVPAKK